MWFWLCLMYCEAVEIFHIPFYPTAVSMVMEGTDAKPATAFWKTTNGIGRQVSTRALLRNLGLQHQFGRGALTKHYLFPIMRFCCSL